MQRTAMIERNTKETHISLTLGLQSYSAENQIDSGLPFMDHMLEAFAKHGKFKLNLTCKGDLQVDAHHTMEDLGIALGQACKQALGDKRGITRFGACILPMDGSLARVTIDLSGRPCLVWQAEFPEWQAGGISVSLFKEFFQALTNNAAMNLHVDLLRCDETHHGLEAIFKATARALRQAVELDPELEGQIPSSKGVLE
ncbi:MAG: imidazoleglycerol-phosphate dehydratase HisB [Oligosphaeraceae bacterium]|nr:imidazoleglycerol-phosphate dehydratase HisB [Oligosphaeraceae bacterium]